MSQPAPLPPPEPQRIPTAAAEWGTVTGAGLSNGGYVDLRTQPGRYYPPTRLRSERVVIQSPMSFTGSAKRSWKLTHAGPAPMKLVTVPLALMVLVAWWSVIVGWYAMFGLLVVPWRVLRRGSRKRKREALRHRELLEAVRDRRRRL